MALAGHMGRPSSANRNVLCCTDTSRLTSVVGMIGHILDHRRLDLLEQRDLLIGLALA